MPSNPRIFYFLLIAVPFCSAANTYADEAGPDFRLLRPTDVPSLATSGPSGVLNVPDGRTLPDGALVFGVNNSLGREFARYRAGETYQFGIGLFRYVELSGRLANYPQNANRDIGLRDLSANIKIAIPKLFDFQPDIALGMNDLGGGAPNFKSKYIAVSEDFGPLRINAGAARGRPYLGRYFGSVELALWDTGAAVIMERNDSTNKLGLRFGSKPIGVFGNARIIATVQRAFRSSTLDGRPDNRSAVGINVLFPLGDNARDRSRIAPENAPLLATIAPIQAAPPSPVPAAHAPAIARSPAATVAGASTALVSAVHVPPASPPIAPAAAALAQVRAALVKAGLERVRVGRRGAELVIEYENHRYNQNEVDAIGIALGAGVMLAPAEIESVSVVTKKAGLSLYRTTVALASYRRFMQDGLSSGARAGLTFQYRSDNGADVEWQDQAEGPRGYSRIRIDPQLIKFVGTELGVFDYSLAANVQGFVPLWKGAELMTSVISTVAESHNVAHGFFGWAQQRNGLKSAVLSQAFWLTDRIANVTTAGKFLYDSVGVQNETTWFLPYRDDQVRAQFTRVSRHEGHRRRVVEAGGASYLLNYAPLQASVEVGYNRYQGGDSGPSVQLNRWFGDVEAQLYLRKSNLEARVGFALALPLTPRQGMRPGFTHVEGASSFPLKLETKLAQVGECNCISAGVVEEIPMAYSARLNLFNNGRMGKDYLASQLPRMREAALAYVTLLK